MSVDAKKTRAQDLCVTPQHTYLLEEVLFKADILGGIVEHLYRPDATRLSAVCRRLRALLKTDAVEHQPRLLVLAANYLAYMDMQTGREIQRTAQQLPGCGDLQNFAFIMTRGPERHICLAVYENHIYTCCQKPPKDYVQPRPTVLRYSTNDLSHVGTAAELQQYEDEAEDGIEVEDLCLGLAFSKGYMYIAMCAGHIRRIALHPDSQSFQSSNPHESPENPGSPDDIYKLPLAGNFQMRVYPACMATGPDGNLYIVVNEDCGEDEGHHGRRKTRSYVMVGILGATGAILSTKPFCGLSENLVQPAGLCFDDQGNLYVTCMTNRVLQYSGPLAENPGQFLRVAAQWTPPSHDSTNAENYFPHDVKWHKGINGIGAPGEPLLLVVRQHGQERSRLAIFSAVSGRLLKELGFPHEENSLVSHMFSMKYILVD